MTRRTLVAGVGNIFLGDDGFGVEVVRRLSASSGAQRSAEGGLLTIRDFGISTTHLAFELLEPYAQLVVIDAMARGGAAGSLYVLEPEVTTLITPVAADAHAMSLSAALSQARAMGAQLPAVRIVGCEPATLDEGIGLSAAVRAAVEPAIDLVQRLLRQ